MAAETTLLSSIYDSRFKLFHELMSVKVREILLVSTPYDAWIMEEDCRLSEGIIHEYRGLNLSRPPRLTWVSSASEALAALDKKKFQLVITMQRLAGMDIFELGRVIKKKDPNLPVILLSHSFLPPEANISNNLQTTAIDQIFIWSGDTQILVALIKSVEDRLNVNRDTQFAGIRVILLVDDSPIYLSSFLPVLYKELVSQTQALIEERLNDEHRLLTMRARPKILIADSYERALEIYENYKPYILGVISDTRFPTMGKMDDEAGIELLSHIKADRWDIPLLLTSSEPSNADKAVKIPAAFIDKNSPSLNREVRSFFQEELGFGDFVFRTPEGIEIQRVPNLRALEDALPEIPDESFFYHWSRNDFSRWLFARTEIVLASDLRPATAEDFEYKVGDMKRYLYTHIREQRRRRLTGVVVNFDPVDFDLETEFFKIGTGSLGGKARGLAFFSNVVGDNTHFLEQYQSVNIFVPQTLVITTEGFDAFIEDNKLEYLSKVDMPDEEVAQIFLQSTFPQWLSELLHAYLLKIKYPLAIRSSSLLEDAQDRTYAGLYRTYMLPNDHPDNKERLRHMIAAIKLVYASTYFNGPKAFSKRVGHRTEEEKMAVIIQQLVGDTYGNYYYPTLSGVGQSYNYFPFGKMKPEEGIVRIALGLGKIVMEGRQTLRFSPKYPEMIPGRANVEDILKNAQQDFYALEMNQPIQDLSIGEDATLVRRNVMDAQTEPSIISMSSTYYPEEQRIRESPGRSGHGVLTFNRVLKYNQIPLADILQKILAMGEQGMGCSVEVEFSVELSSTNRTRPQLAVLQIRPMTATEEQMQVDIGTEDRGRAFCVSSKSLGNTDRDDMVDVVFVNPDVFDPAQTQAIAADIRRINVGLVKSGRQYLLVGPGRWGSADRWLGIPVRWPDICGVGAIVETFISQLKAEPSQGSHFFHNITTLGINYITVGQEKEDYLNWDVLKGLPRIDETFYVVHARVKQKMRIKVDGRSSCGVVFFET